MAGGANRYIHEVFRRLSKRFEITVLAEGPEHNTTTVKLDGISYVNSKRFFPRLRIPFRFLSQYAHNADLIIDNGDVAVPWLSPLFSRIPRIALIHQLVRDIFFYEWPRPLAQLGFVLEPTIYRLYRASRVVVVSRSTASDLVALGIPTRKISLIRPGCSLTMPSIELGKRDQKMICCVSRLMRYKGLQFAIRALDRVLRTSPGVLFRVVGSGPHSRSLREIASSSRVDRSVEFLGNLSEKQKLQVIGESRVALMPSVREGYGMSVIEANSVGTPTVGWDVPGLRDSIIDGQTGLLAPFCDIQEMADKISSLLLDDELWTRLSNNSVKWARSHSWDEAANDFEEVIQQTLRVRR